MEHLLPLSQTMETCSPTLEEEIASNVLASWSSSRLDPARFPVLGSKGFIINNNKSSSSRSSDSRANYNNSISSNSCGSSEAKDQACTSSDLEEDGVHGGRMKPLSGLDSNSETGQRCSIPHLSSKKGPHSPANPTSSNVLAAARVGHRARYRTISHSDGKENIIMAHIREMQATHKKPKGVKRKSLGHEGNACFSAHKQKISFLSTWETGTSNSKAASAHSEITGVRDIDYVPNTTCRDLQVSTKSPDRVNSSSKVATIPVLRPQNHLKTVEEKANVSLGSPPQGLSLLGAATCSTSASNQGFSLPTTGSGKGKRCFFNADHTGKGMHESLCLTKGEIIIGLPCTKPPTYPKNKLTVTGIVKVKDKGHLVVDASHCNATDVAGSDCNSVSMNKTQPSSSKLLDMPCGNVKIEEYSERFAGEAGPSSPAAGKYHVARTKLSHANGSGSHVTDFSGLAEDIKSEEEAFEKVFFTQSDLTQKLPGLSRDLSLLKPSSSKACTPCRSEKVVILRQSPCLVNAPTVNNCQTVPNGAEGKLEKSFQGSAEIHIKGGNVDLNCEDNSSHLCSVMSRAKENFSCSTREGIREPLRHNPDALNALKLPGEFETYDHNRLPNFQHCTNVNGAQSCNKSTISATEMPDNCFTYGARAATGSTLCHQNIAHGQHISLCLPKLRRGRKPKKTNVCPCPQKKEHVNKFARICAPSGILGELNPGIITRFRDKNQVHAALGAVIGAAIMNASSYGKGDLFRSQEAKEGVSADAFQELHGEYKEKSAKWRKSTDMKEREAHLTLAATQDSATVIGLTTRATRDERVKTGQLLNGIEYVVKDSVKSHTARLGRSETIEARKHENTSYEKAARDTNVHLSYSLQASEKGFKDASIDRRSSGLQFSEAEQQKQDSEGLCDQNKLSPRGLHPSNDSSKVVNQSVKNATAACTAENVASCWLELLRLDIKGRLSALKRSRRRVRSVIVSGQLDDKMPKKPIRWDDVVGAGGKESEANEMQKWRAFFLHMDGVLCSEGARLENWLSQIAGMQSHCQKMSTQSCMPPKCEMGFLNVELDGASRLREAMEIDLALATSAASMFTTVNLAKTMEITS